MKKAKILLLPLSVLLLGGCTFNDVKSWVGNNVYFPVRNFLDDIMNPNEDGKKEDEKKEDEPSGEDEEWTVVSAESVLDDYSKKKDAPYTHVNAKISLTEGSDTETDEANYDYNSEQQKWLIVGEASTGTQFSEELLEYIVTDEMITSYVEDESLDCELKKSKDGKYKMTTHAENNENAMDAEFLFDQYFYIETYSDIYLVSGTVDSTLSLTFTWSN